MTTWYSQIGRRIRPHGLSVDA